MIRLSFAFGKRDLHIDMDQVIFEDCLTEDKKAWLYMRMEQGLPIAYKGALGELRIINTQRVNMIEVKEQ